MKALIFCINSKYIHSSLAPWCLLAGVRTYCDDSIIATVGESTINRKLEDTLKDITDSQPDVIALSCYIWNMVYIKELLPMIKKALPNVTIILGGPEVSYNCDNVLNEVSEADFIISGEGEEPVALLLNALNKHEKHICDIKGIAFRNNDGTNFVSEPNTPSDEPPTPYCDEYFDSLKGRIAYLETSRGCPYSCAFCLSGRCGTVRFYDINRAKNEILLLANSGTQTVKLVDRTFNCNRARAKELWQFIIDNHGVNIPKNVCFHFEIAGDILDDESIKILASAPVGSIQLEIGLQSFNEDTLKAINRKTNTKILRENIKKLLAPRNIHVHIDLIAGLPLEGYDSFGDSFNIAYELYPNMLQLGFLKLLHGAVLRETAEEDGCIYSDIPPYEMSEGKWISKEDILKLHYIEDMLERIYNSGRFTRTANYALNATGLSSFEFYEKLGEKARIADVKTKMSLDDFTEFLYKSLCEFNKIDVNLLRDNMVCDRLSTVNTGKLPNSLKIKDDNLKKVVKALNEKYPLAKNMRRGIAILYGENKAVFADYANEDKNAVSGQYPITKITLQDLQVEI